MLSLRPVVVPVAKCHPSCASKFPSHGVPECTGNKQQQPKVVRDSFEVFQDQGKNTGGTRAKGATAAGLPGNDLLKQGKPKAGMAGTHDVASHKLD